MKNLTHYFESAEDLYDNTVARKEEIGLRQRLENLSAAVYERYRIYEDAFDNSNLESIAIDPAFEHHSNDLGALYGYNFSTIKEFRKSLEDLQPLTIRYTCQYCTLSRHDSIDHYLPQSSFPEYSIYTRNLVLCCTSCNRIKWRSWLTNGRREFINFYLDQLPAVQYLLQKSCGKQMANLILGIILPMCME